MKKALCAYHPTPDIFHADKGRSKDSLEAMKTCMKCPVQAACSDYRQRIDSNVGVWGGQAQTRNSNKKP